jgi:predicted heme/steroid binding protein
LTETQLSSYDGRTPGEPIYLAIDGDVYDVTAGRESYGPGGSYSIFAGRDAARGTLFDDSNLLHENKSVTHEKVADRNYVQLSSLDASKPI